MTKTGTEENSVLNAWVKVFPAVQRFPDYKLIIMDALAGQKIRLAKSKAVNGQKADPQHSDSFRSFSRLGD